MTSRNYGIHSRRPMPWGHSGDRPPAYDAISRADSSDHYELGGFLLFGGVVLSPVVIVLGLVMAYMVFS